MTSEGRQESAPARSPALDGSSTSSTHDRPLSIIAPSRERRLFDLHGTESLVAGMLFHPVSDAYAAVIAAGRYVGPFRLESSLGTTDWVPGISRLVFSPDGDALTYVEEQADGAFVVGPSRWGPCHWIAAGPRFDASGTSIAWLENASGGGDALWVDGVRVARAEPGSWDPHEGSPLSLPFDHGLPDASRPEVRLVTSHASGDAGEVTEQFAFTDVRRAPITRVRHAGHWRARIGDAMTAPVPWMSDPIAKGDDLVGFLVRADATVYWREYRAAIADGAA